MVTSPDLESSPQVMKLNAVAASVAEEDVTTNQGSTGAARLSDSPHHRKQQERKSRWWLQPKPEWCEEVARCPQNSSKEAYESIAVMPTASRARARAQYAEDRGRAASAAAAVGVAKHKAGLFVGGWPPHVSETLFVQYPQFLE